jgi:hypothetical protein
MTTLNDVVASLQKERGRLQSELQQVSRALEALGQAGGNRANGANKRTGRKARRTLSPEARRRIADAQRKRWAKVRKQSAKQSK